MSIFLEVFLKMEDQLRTLDLNYTQVVELGEELGQWAFFKEPRYQRTVRSPKIMERVGGYYLIVDEQSSDEKYFIQSKDGTIYCTHPISK